MNPDPKTLDDLFERAQHYADWVLQDKGSMRPTIFLLTEEGQMAMIVYGNNIEDVKDKDALVQVAQMLCIAYAANAVVLAIESWVRHGVEGDGNDTPPSESFDRREVVMLLGESRAASRLKSLPIIRHDNEKYFGLGENEFPATGKISGRFTKLLPERVPPEDMRTLAELFLHIKGLKIVRDFGKPKK